MGAWTCAPTVDSDLEGSLRYESEWYIFIGFTQLDTFEEALSRQFLVVHQTVPPPGRERESLSHKRNMLITSLRGTIPPKIVHISRLQS